jgi:ribosomal protein S27AE
MKPGDRSGEDPRPLHDERGFSRTVAEELARVRGRKLGACVACGRAVFMAESFTRLRGRVRHVRCPMAPVRSPASDEALDQASPHSPPLRPSVIRCSSPSAVSTRKTA